MSKMYRVTGIERLGLSMEIAADSISDARKKFDDYVIEGASGWDAIDVTTRVEEIKEGGGE